MERVRGNLCKGTDGKFAACTSMSGVGKAKRKRKRTRTRRKTKR